jgi:hypothetical protein
VLVSVCLFAAGLLTYAYLPLRALTDPPMNWGDPSTPPRLYNHVTRSQYGAFGPMKAEEPRSLARFGRQLEYIGRSAIDDLTVPLFAAALAGIVVLLFQDRRIFLLVALWLVWNGPLFALMANFGFDRTAQWSHRVFLIPMMLGLAIPIAYLLDFIQRGLSLVLPGEQRMALAIGFLPALAAPATLLAANWGRCDYSNYWYAYDHGRNLLDSTLPGAMIFPSGDHNTFPLAYLTQVENVRPDVLIADIYGYVTPELYADRPGNSEATPEVWLINHQRRPAYFTTKKSLPVDKASMVVSGLLYHLLPDHIPFDETGLRELNRYRNLEDPGVIDLGASHILADHHFYKGWYALKDNDLETALRHFRQAAGFGHGIREVFNNIGSALGEHGHADLAQDYFLRAAEIDRHYTMPRWNLFRAYRNQREFDKACDMLEQLIEADPNDPRPYGEMGFIQNMHYRDTAAAVKYWRLSLERHPAQPQIIEALRQAGQAVQAPPERP